MKKKSIVLLLVVCCLYGSGDLRERRTSTKTSSPNNIQHPLPYPEPSQQEIQARLATKDPHQLKKEVCVGICCYTCVSTAAITTYYASAYLLGTLKNEILRRLNMSTN